MAQNEIMLFVDGEKLKKELQKNGETYCTQSIQKALHRMANAVACNHPEAGLSVLYFHVNETTTVFPQTPICHKKMQHIYARAPYHLSVNDKKIPLMIDEVKTIVVSDHPWIMKRSSLKKEPAILTDEDFILNLRTKGLVSKMSDAMIFNSLVAPKQALFFYGDKEDMNYVLNVCKSFGSDVYEVTQDEDKRYTIKNIKTQKQVLSIHDMEAIKKIQTVPNVRQMTPFKVYKTLSELRSKFDYEENGEESWLMIDGGLIQKMLCDDNKYMDKKSLASIIQQIVKELPTKPNHIIFYHTKNVVSKVKNPVSSSHSIKKQMDKNIFDIPGIHFNLGLLTQSKENPFVLGENKWLIYHFQRMAKDYIPNLFQKDVDDRIVADLSLARFNPKLKKIYLISSDSDFMPSVERAKESGIEVSMVVLNGKTNPKLNSVASEEIFVNPSTKYCTKIAEDEMEVKKKKGGSAVKYQKEEEDWSNISYSNYVKINRQASKTEREIAIRKAKKQIQKKDRKKWKQTMLNKNLYTWENRVKEESW